eukprot:321059_1
MECKTRSDLIVTLNNHISNTNLEHALSFLNRMDLMSIIHTSKHDFEFVHASEHLARIFFDRIIKKQDLSSDKPSTLYNAILTLKIFYQTNIFKMVSRIITYN